MVHLLIQSRSHAFETNYTRTDLKLLGRGVHAHECWLSNGVCAQRRLRFDSNELSLSSPEVTSHFMQHTAHSKYALKYREIMLIT